MNNKDIDINKMSEQSGENSLMGAPRYNLPIVRLQGQKGIFQRITKDSEGKTKTEDIGDKIQGTTLKFMRTLNQFTKEESFFTTEHSSFNDIITLFNVTKKVDGTKSVMMIDEGTAKEIKDKHQGLKMTQVIYFLMGKEIVKLQVKGSSLSNLFEFRQEIKKKKDKHFFQFVLEIDKTKKEGPLGVYYAMEFSVKEEIKDLKPVAGKMEEVSDKLEEISNYYKNKPTAEQEGKEIASAILESGDPKDVKEKLRTTTAQIKENSEIPTVEDKEEEINVDELPFK